MKHTVHIFAVVKVKVTDVEASSHGEAIDKAVRETDLHSLLAGPTTEYAEEISHYLVDEENDPEFTHSWWYRDANHTKQASETWAPIHNPKE